MLTILSSIAGICVMYLLGSWYLRNYHRQATLALKLKGPTAYPFIGNLSLVNPSRIIQELQSNLRKKYGGIFRLWVPIIPIFVLTDPSYVQTIMSSKVHQNKAHLYTIFTKVLGPRSLVIINDPEMSRKRKLQQRLFTSSSYEKYLEIFRVVAKIFAKEIGMEVGKEQNIVKKSNQCIKNISNCVILGISTEDLDNEKVEKLITTQTNLLPRLSRPWLLVKGIYRFTKTYEHEDSVYGKTMEFLHQRASKVQQEIDSEPEDRLSLLRMLMGVAKENPDYSLNDVLDDTLTYLVAGSDATASGVAFILYELARHPEYQEKCYQEQLQILGEHDRPPTLMDMTEMRFLERCINESARIHPPIPMIARKVNEDVQLGSVQVPSGSTIVIPIYALHHDEESFPDPRKYDPDRFLPHVMDKRPKGAFIPFSYGQRTCPGNKLAMLAIKSIASAVIRNFTLSLVEGKEEIQHMYRITLQAHKGIWIKVNRR